MRARKLDRSVKTRAAPRAHFELTKHLNGLLFSTPFLEKRGRTGVEKGQKRGGKGWKRGRKAFLLDYPPSSCLQATPLQTSKHKPHPTSLPTCLPAFLPPATPPKVLPTDLPTYLPTCLDRSLPTYMHSKVPPYLLICLICCFGCTPDLSHDFFLHYRAMFLSSSRSRCP